MSRCFENHLIFYNYAQCNGPQVFVHSSIFGFTILIQAVDIEIRSISSISIAKIYTRFILRNLKHAELLSTMLCGFTGA